MNFTRILVLSLLVAFVSGGFVWYGIALYRNVKHTLRALRERRARKAEEADTKEGSAS